MNDFCVSSVVTKNSSHISRWSLDHHPSELCIRFTILALRLQIGTISHLYSISSILGNGEVAEETVHASAQSHASARFTSSQRSRISSFILPQK